MKNLIRGLEVLNSLCVKCAKFIAAICVATQIIIIFCGVIWRYFLQSPLRWVDEFASLLLVVIAFLGCYIALSQSKLARIELLISSFKGKRRTAAYVISELFTLSMLVIVVYYGTQMFLSPTSLQQKTPGMYIPLWIFYGLIPLSFTCCIVQTVTKILRHISDNGEEESSC